LREICLLLQKLCHRRPRALHLPRVRPRALHLPRVRPRALHLPRVRPRALHLPRARLRRVHPRAHLACLILMMLLLIERNITGTYQY
jgi:hypothetical protein